MKTPVYDNVYDILPHKELKSYIKTFLIDNIEFINDVSNTLITQLATNLEHIYLKF